MIYKATVDTMTETLPVYGCGCDWHGTVADVAEIGDACLTPGDPSPVGRCPECGDLVYVDTPEARAMDNAKAMLEMLRDFLNLTLDESDPAVAVRVKRAQAILARIDGEV